MKKVTISFLTDAPNSNIASITSIIDIVTNLQISVEDSGLPVGIKPKLPAAVPFKPQKSIKRHGRKINPLRDREQVIVPKNSKRPTIEIDGKIGYTNPTYDRWHHDKRVVFQIGHHGFVIFNLQQTLTNMGLTQTDLMRTHWRNGTLESSLLRAAWMRTPIHREKMSIAAAQRGSSGHA